MTSARNVLKQKPLEHRDWLSLPQSGKKNSNIFSSVVARVKETDHLLFGAITILLLINLALSFISTFNISLKLTGDPYYMAMKQFFALVLSFATIIFFIFVRIEKLYNYPIVLYAFCVVLLSIIFVEGIGKEVSGAKRWIAISGLRFQPSEFVKIFLFFILSHQIAKKEIANIDSFRGKVFPPFFVLASVCSLIAIEPDLSTAFIIFLSGLLLFLSSSIKVLHIFSALAFVLPFAILFLQSKRYYLDRFLFFSPDSEPFGRGYHLLQSLKAFYYGGSNGESISQSITHLATLPDAHNDFIFSVVGNLSGMVGVLLVEILFAIIALRGFAITKKQKNSAHQYLCLSLTYLITTQTILHMLVTVGLIPTTGINLPFLSYGGSALISNSMMAGILLHFSREHVIKENAA